jgi:hypothetical protein
LNNVRLVHLITTTITTTLNASSLALVRVLAHVTVSVSTANFVSSASPTSLVDALARIVGRSDFGNGASARMVVAITSHAKGNQVDEEKDDDELVCHGHFPEIEVTIVV